MKLIIQQTVKLVAESLVIVLMSVSAFAADRIEGRVEAGGRPVAGSDVTFWVAGPGAPQKLAETQTRDDGSFDVRIVGERDGAGVLYLIAKGGVAKGGSRQEVQSSDHVHGHIGNSSATACCDQ